MRMGDQNVVGVDRMVFKGRWSGDHHFQETVKGEQTGKAFVR